MVEPEAHRPVITGRHGMASTGHSLASCEALNVLKKGGNAWMAALVAAAVLSVIKSYHCGLGGDVFALYYSASDKKLYCLKGRENLQVCSGASSTKTKFLREGRLRPTCRGRSTHGSRSRTDSPADPSKNCGSRPLTTPQMGSRYFLISLA